MYCSCTMCRESSASQPALVVRFRTLHNHRDTNWPINANHAYVMQTIRPHPRYVPRSISLANLCSDIWPPRWIIMQSPPREVSDEPTGHCFAPWAGATSGPLGRNGLAASMTTEDRTAKFPIGQMQEYRVLQHLVVGEMPWSSTEQHNQGQRARKASLHVPA